MNHTEFKVHDKVTLRNPIHEKARVVLLLIDWDGIEPLEVIRTDPRKRIAFLYWNDNQELDFPFYVLQHAPK